MRKGEIIQENLRYKTLLENEHKRVKVLMERVKELENQLEIYKIKDEKQLWKLTLDE